MTPDDRMPDRASLVWLLLRWLPAVLMVTLLTTWSLVMLGGMARVVGWLFLLFLWPWIGLLIGFVVLLYALIRRRISRPMVVTWGLMLVVFWPALWEHGYLAVPFPAGDAPAAEVRLPTDRAMRVYWGGQELEHNYHALYPDQRWAYDLVIEPAGLGSTQLSDYGCYGVPVRAPASGTVVAIHEEDPDATPGEIAPTENSAGNHVWLELADHSYLLLAHLQSGSVRVRPGDRLEAGTVLGACGNSGRTSEPHVHLHRQREDPRTHPPGLAEGLPIRFIEVRGPAQPQGGVRKNGDHLELLGDLLTPTLTSSSAKR